MPCEPERGASRTCMGIVDEAARLTPIWAGTAARDFAYTADLARPLVTPATKALFLNFPSNPVGALAELDELREFVELGPLVVSDEVYHPLVFDQERVHTVLE